MGKTSFKSTWKAVRLVGHEHEIPPEYFHNEDVYQVVDRIVNAAVRGAKGALKVPGYRVYEDEIISTRRV